METNSVEKKSKKGKNINFKEFLRIIRAFLTEEVKIVKKVMNQARTATKKEKKVAVKKE